MEVIGMAAIDRDLALSEGETVEVPLGEGNLTARVAAIPLYDTAKTRPRS